MISDKLNSVIEKSIEKLLKDNNEKVTFFAFIHYLVKIYYYK